MANHLRTELVLDELNIGVSRRRTDSIVHYSVRGCQYYSYAFGKRCREMGVVPSTDSVGAFWHNAMAESFFATVVFELLERRRFPT